MASISLGGKTLSKHSKMQTAKTKQNLPKSSLLLKDYLIRDDLSSCSSNGFKSFPRRQCCSPVGLILVDKKDLKLQQRKRRRSRRTNSNTLLLPQPPRSTSSSCSSSKVSVLQRASKAAINAIKSSLPLNCSDKKTVAAARILSRSFSRKLLSRSFWKKSTKKEELLGGGEGTQRWRTSFRELLKLDRDKTTTSFNEDSVVSVFAAPSSSSTITTTSSSGCGSNNSWGESEFTFSSSSAASSSESSAENDVAEGTKEAVHRDKIDEAMRDWPTNEEKEEQFSPVSVLDCPFEDDEGITPHFNSTTHSLRKGAEHKHMLKRRHFESVGSVEPVALEKRMTRSEMEDEPHNNSTKNSVLVPIKPTQNGSTNMPHFNIEENARDLLNLVKRSIPSNLLIIKAENLLFDYFKQSVVENNIDVDHNQSKKLHLCKVAEDWINGQPQEVYLGWEVQEGRQVYIKEMDKCVEWRNTDREVQLLVIELENEVFSSLVNEIILDHLTIC